jgi:hypothetical protein
MTLSSSAEAPATGPNGRRVSGATRLRSTRPRIGELHGLVEPGAGPVRGRVEPGRGPVSNLMDEAHLVGEPCGSRRRRASSCPPWQGGSCSYASLLGRGARRHAPWDAFLGVELRRCHDGAAGAGVSPRRAGKGRHAVGVPLPGRRARFQACAAGRLRFRAGERGLVEPPTLAEFVEVYLAQHEGEPETTAPGPARARIGSSRQLQVDAELAQLDDRRPAPADRVG